MLKLASTAIGGVIGAITIVFAIIVYSDSSVMADFWGNPFGHKGPLWAALAGVFLVAGAIFVIRIPDIAFTLYAASIIVGLAGGWVVGWGFIVVPVVGAAVAGSLLIVKYKERGPAIQLVERWFAD